MSIQQLYMHLNELEGSVIELQTYLENSHISKLGIHVDVGFPI